MDVMKMSGTIDELKNLQNNAYLKAMSPELRQTLQFGLGLVVAKQQEEIELRQNAAKLMAMDKALLDAGDPKQCSLYKGFYHITNRAEEINAVKYGLVNPFRERDECLFHNADAFQKLALKVCADVMKANAPLIGDFDRIDKYDHIFNGFTKYASIERIKMEKPPKEQLISKRGVNCSGELLVIASRSVQVYQLNQFMDLKSSFLFGLNTYSYSEDNTISSVSWSPVDSHTLAQCDYYGRTKVHDIEKRKVVNQWLENRNKLWNIDFNKVDKNLFATAGDDTYVKLFNINCQRAVAEIKKDCSVCSVAFRLSNRNHLIVGSAENKAHLHDIRNLQKPVMTFEGHKRCIAQIQFLNNDEFVTSSTDSTLRAWNVNSGECLSTLQGHTNNTVLCGLSSSEDHIIAGSENNDVYLFHKNSTKPITKYTLDDAPELREDERRRVYYVSAIEWIPNTDFLIAANSHGNLHLLMLI